MANVRVANRPVHIDEMVTLSLILVGLRNIATKIGQSTAAHLFKISDEMNER